MHAGHKGVKEYSLSLSLLSLTAPWTRTCSTLTFSMGRRFIPVSRDKPAAQAAWFIIKTKPYTKSSPLIHHGRKWIPWKGPENAGSKGPVSCSFHQNEANIFITIWSSDKDIKTITKKIWQICSFYYINVFLSSTYNENKPAQQEKLFPWEIILFPVENLELESLEWSKAFWYDTALGLGAARVMEGSPSGWHQSLTLHFFVLIVEQNFRVSRAKEIYSILLFRKCNLKDNPDCYGLNCIPPKLACWCPNPQYLRKWLHLERSLRRSLR